MKCNRCPKPATLHITEVLADEQFEELHLCEECAQKYLYEPSQKKASAKNGAETDDEDAGPLSDKQCDACGIKFVEFRNTGRLGCPHDYEAFRHELMPLLESIHGDTKHQGKTPRRLPQTKHAQSELTKLRQELHQAVSQEDYEAAARIRDKIRQLEAI
jgi:protein arginine kinase activator